jgi:hypothetical protein
VRKYTLNSSSATAEENKIQSTFWGFENQRPGF